MKFIRSLYIHQNVYYYISLIAMVFLLSFWMEFLFPIASYMGLALICFFSADIYLLYRRKAGIMGKRELTLKFSNSDENIVPIAIRSFYDFSIEVTVIDELPPQFQKRDFNHTVKIPARESYQFEYTVRPVERGEYSFGRLNMYVSSFFKIIARKYEFQKNQSVAVYPSYIQMKKYEFLALSNKLTEYGLKKIRRIGHTMEFEQIKNYIPGDDVRTINWKATAKKSELMVNQYQDEKSQPIYAIIDTGRAMKMPFEGLKLLDYAINATLAFSNIALRKNDKAGMITFSKKMDDLIPASNKKTHLNVINEALYAISTQYEDANYGYLYNAIKRKIKQRSLLIVYTNFEHKSALNRQLPYLKAIAKSHLLVVVFFENTELDELIMSNAEDLQGVYIKTIAEKFAYEKRLIVKELEAHGIFGILTKPTHLTVNVINKYLEFKAKGLI